MDIIIYNCDNLLYAKDAFLLIGCNDQLQKYEHSGNQIVIMSLTLTVKTTTIKMVAQGQLNRPFVSIMKSIREI